MVNVFERSNILTASCNTFVTIRVEISSSRHHGERYGHTTVSSRWIALAEMNLNESSLRCYLLSLTATAIKRSRNGRFSKYRGSVRKCFLTFVPSPLGNACYAG